MDAKPSNWTLRRRPLRLLEWPPPFWMGRIDESASSIPGPELHDACIHVQSATGGVTALV
jgi:hypothetical protein